MWQFTEAIKGLVDGCKVLGVPVTGGNVSFYNQTDGINILPTPLVGMLGVIDDVRLRIRQGFAHAGDTVLLLGDSKQELGGSAWEDVMHGHHLGGLPPFPDFDAEIALGKVLQAAAKQQLVSSAHDLSEGGLAVALVESCLHGNHGVSFTLPTDLDPCAELFSETQARAVVSLPPQSVAEFTTLCADAGVPVREPVRCAATSCWRRADSSPCSSTSCARSGSQPFRKQCRGIEQWRQAVIRKSSTRFARCCRACSTTCGPWCASRR